MVLLVSRTDQNRFVARLRVSVVALFILGGCSTVNQKTLVAEEASQLSEYGKKKNIAATTNKLFNEFDTFLTSQDINSGAIAVAFNGELVGVAGKNRRAKTPVKIASLSKAITAVCVMKALGNTTHSLQSTLMDIIPDKLELEPAGMGKLGSITIEELMSHKSGITIAHLSKQGRLINRYDKEQKDWQLRNIIKWTPHKIIDGIYRYANANYLILGIVIERLTDMSYESYCAQQVLTPIGISNARLNPRWRILSSYGGWEMSAEDYLKFADAYFREDWQSQFPNVNGLSRSSLVYGNYGLGASKKTAFGRSSFRHSGSLTWNSSTHRARFASYFIVNQNGFSVSLNYSNDGSQGRNAAIASKIDRVLKDYEP